MTERTDRFSIHAATAADAARLAAFGARLFRDAFASFNRAADMDAYVNAAFAPDLQRATLADDRVTTLLCSESGSWVGYVELRRTPPPGQPDSADSIEIRRFYVDRPWHGSGAAQALLAAAAERAQAGGAALLWLGVWERNPRAAAFYRKAGFAKVGSQTFQLGTDRQTDAVMTCAVADLRLT